MLQLGEPEVALRGLAKLSDVTLIRMERTGAAITLTSMFIILIPWSSVTSFPHYVSYGVLGVILNCLAVDALSRRTSLWRPLRQPLRIASIRPMSREETAVSFMLSPRTSYLVSGTISDDIAVGDFVTGMVYDYVDSDKKWVCGLSKMPAPH